MTTKKAATKAADKQTSSHPPKQKWGVHFDGTASVSAYIEIEAETEGEARDAALDRLSNSLKMSELEFHEIRMNEEISFVEALD